LLSTLVFSMSRSAIRDVVVGGRFILRDRRHEYREEIVDRYKELHEAVWSGMLLHADRAGSVYTQG
jgi:formimidoylglutamate deiminase